MGLPPKLMRERARLRLRENVLAAGRPDLCHSVYLGAGDAIWAKAFTTFLPFAAL